MKTTNARSVLILERDEPFRESLIEILDMNGYKVHHAKNGYLGIKLAKEELPDLILCASAFSDINCWEVFQILKREKQTRHIPFICLSSRPLIDDKKDLPDKVAILIKPFSPEELITTIQNSFSLS